MSWTLEIRSESLGVPILIYKSTQASLIFRFKSKQYPANTFPHRLSYPQYIVNICVWTMIALNNKCVLYKKVLIDLIRMSCPCQLIYTAGGLFD